MTPFIGKLGCKPIVIDPRVPNLAHRANLSAIVPRVGTLGRASLPIRWGMLGNDDYADCVEAAMFHLAQLRRFIVMGDLWQPANDNALGLYGILTPFKVADPATDQGTEPVSAWVYWATKGLVLPGMLDVAAAAIVDPSNDNHMRAGIDALGGLGVSLNLPKCVTTRTDWEIPAGGLTCDAGIPGGLGAHEVAAIDVDDFWYYVVTWGRVVRVSKPFMRAYGMQAQASVSRETWLRTDGMSPANLNWQQLDQDRLALAA